MKMPVVFLYDVFCAVIFVVEEMLQSDCVLSDAAPMVHLMPSDSTSQTSNDSQLPYHKMEDSSSYKMELEHGSYSDDTEALLRSMSTSCYSSLDRHFMLIIIVIVPVLLLCHIAF